MRKLIYLLSISSVMMLFTSCFEKIDNWYTNTSSYDGRFSVAVTCEEDEDYDRDIRDGYELWIYNSAANVEDEIIIDTQVAVYIDEDGEIEEEGFPVRGKFKVTGNPLNFQGGSESVNLYSSSELNDDEYYLIIGGRFYSPSDLEDDDVGEEFDAIHLYARVSLEEGKITPLGATTIGGNKSDGVSLKITTYCDYLIVESYETPQDTWADPEEPEYAWRVKEGSRTNADGWEEHWTFDGYRYTGYPEDLGGQPPIIVK